MPTLQDDQHAPSRGSTPGGRIEEIDRLNAVYDQPAISASDRNINGSAKNRILAAEQQAARGNVQNQLGVRDTGGNPHNDSYADGPDAMNGEGMSEPLSSDKIQDKEKEAAQDGSFYKDDSGWPMQKKPKGMLDRLAKIPGVRSKRRAMVLFASMLSGLVSSIAGFFGMMAPLQALSIPQFLQNMFFSSTNNASQRLSEQLWTSYVRHYLIPSLVPGTGCADTKVGRHCIGPIQGDGPISLLFNRWRGVKNMELEHKMALQGIEIQSDGGRYFMRAPGLDNPVDLESVRNGTVTNMFDMKEVSRSDVRAHLRQAFQDESFFKKLYYRHRIGRLLQQKYGIVRCYIACDFKDKVHGKITSQKRAFLALFARRILEPRSEMIGVVFQCLFQNCPDLKSSTNPDVTPDEDGNTNPGASEPMDDFDRQTRDAIRRLAAAWPEDKLDNLVKNLEEFKKAGPAKYVFKKVIEKIAGAFVGDELAAEAATKLTNAAGWVLLVIKFLYLVEHGGKLLQQYNYVVNSTAMVGAAYMFITIGDELRSHHVTATTIGSITDSLNGNIDGRSTEPMTASPLYNNIFSASTTSSTTAFIRTFLPAKAYALSATSTTATEKCNDGNTLQQVQKADGGDANMVCDELHLVGFETLLTQASKFLRKIPVLSTIIDIAGSIIGVINDIINAAIQPLLDFPPVKAILDTVTQGITYLLGDIITEFVQWVMSFVIADIFPDDFSSARLIDTVIGGVDSAGNESAHRNIGGAVLTGDQRAQIVNDQTTRENEDFAIRPLKDRMLDTTNQRSFISQVALSTPTNPTQAFQSTVANLLSNPFGKIMQSFASIFSLRQVSAAPANMQGDPFGIAQYGIPIDNKVFQSDPLEYWDQYCKDGRMNKAYNTLVDDITDEQPFPDGSVPKDYGFTVDDDMAGQVVNGKANPCLALGDVANYDRDPPSSDGGASTGTGPRDDPVCGGTYTGPIGGSVQPVPTGPGKTIKVAAGGDVNGSVNSAAPGDVVVVPPGTPYGQLNITVSGEAGKCITIVGDGGKAVFEGGITMNGVKYVRLLNITSKGSSSYGISANGAHFIVFSNVEVDGSADGGIQIADSAGPNAAQPLSPDGFGALRPPEVIIDGCDVHGTNGGQTGNGEGEGISIADGTTDATVRYCKVHQNGEEGIDVKYSNDKVTSSSVHDNEVFSNGGPNIYIDGVNGVKVFNNKVYSVYKKDQGKSGIMLGCESEWAPTGPSQYIEIYNNNLYDNAGRGITVFDGGCGIAHVKVHDNTLTQGDKLELDGATDLTETNNNVQ